MGRQLCSNVANIKRENELAALKSIVLHKHKWATKWAKEERGHEEKKRNAKCSLPKLATITLLNLDHFNDYLPSC